MNWYYAAGGQQQGPVDDAQLDALIQAGTVTQDTLIWREGMASWQPLRQARPSAGGSSVPAAPPVAAADPQLDIGRGAPAPVQPHQVERPRGGHACARPVRGDAFEVGGPGRVARPRRKCGRGKCEDADQRRC